ncbi:MAG: hypothetical protein CSA36_06685 [Draconibacterium sp.]|nr:MAG: hypothetical protein CSA36_06685 [Draconibacterium sp.]
MLFFAQKRNAKVHFTRLSLFNKIKKAPKYSRPFVKYYYSSNILLSDPENRREIKIKVEIAIDEKFHF